MTKATIFLLILILLHLFLLINLKFTVWPEMILYPWLMEHNYNLYQSIIAPYFPGLLITTSLIFKLFSSSVQTLKLFTWALILITDIVLYTLSFKLSKSHLRSGLALLSYILLNLNFGGNSLWFELALTPFLVLGIFLVYLYPKNVKALIISGCLIGVSILIKQNSVIFIIPIVLYLFFKERGKIFFFFLPILGILLLLLLYLLSINILNDFYFWAIKAPLTFSNQPGFILLPSKRQVLFMLILLIPPAFALYSKKIKKIESVFYLLITFFGLLYSFPRYEDFHLQFLIAISSIMICLSPKKLIFVFFNYFFGAIY